MRYFALFAFPLALAAQSADSDRVTQTLISEIQQLRVAIERSTLLNARTQISLSQIQLQETVAARVKQQLDEVRAQAPGSNGHKAMLAARLDDTQRHPITPADMWELKLKELKVDLEQATAQEAVRAARESDLAMQLQQAQSQIADARSRIAEMERALDAAIQQMLKR
jgi:hypothetical protein